MFTEDAVVEAAAPFMGALLTGTSFLLTLFRLVGPGRRTEIIPLVTRSHENVSLPVPPITQTCWQRPPSRPAPPAQPLEAPAPWPRSDLLLAACGPSSVATGSSRSSVVHTALGCLCPWRRAQPSSEATMVWTDTHAVYRGGDDHAPVRFHSCNDVKRAGNESACTRSLTHTGRRN